MEMMVVRDTQEIYENLNNEYREKISRKLGGKSTSEKLAPVFIGGNLKNSSSFLLPIVEEGVINNVRSRFKSIVDPEEHQLQLQHQTMAINQQKGQLGLKFNSRNASLPYNSSNQVIHSPSKMSFLSHKESGMEWGSDFISRVEGIKK